MGVCSSKIDPNAPPPPVMKKDRKCRDVLCILIFIAWWVGMGACAFIGLTYGDPALLTNGVDYLGNVCGSTAVAYECTPGVAASCSSKSVIAFPRIDKDMLAASQSGVNLLDPTAIASIPFFGVCRESCPDPSGDGWVCTYDALSFLHTTYNGVATSDVPSTEGKAVLDECLTIKQSLPGLFATALLSDTTELADGSYAKCRTLMSGCWKMYVQEQPLFFRCIPVSADNSTCAASPYLESIGEAPSYTVDSSGATTVRLSSHDSCGTCLDPLTDEDGAPMDPASDFCRAKKVSAVSETIKAVQNPLFTALNDWTMVLTEWMGDVQLCVEEIIVAGGPGAMLVGIVWLLLMRFFAGIFVWLTLWGFFLCSAGITIQFLVYGGVITTDFISDMFSELNSTGLFTFDAGTAATDFTSTDLFGAEMESQEELYKYAGWAMLVFTVIVLLMIIAMIKRIRIAVAILKEATKAIAAMPSILVFPIITVAMTLILSAYCGMVALYLASAGDIAAKSINSTLPIVTARRRLTLEHGSHMPDMEYWNTQPLSHLHEMEMYGWQDNARQLSNVTDAASSLGVEVVAQFESMDLGTQLWVFNFFGFLWTNALINAIGCTTIAGAVASWYWASDIEAEKSSKMPKFPVAKALGRTMRYHIGSLIFGSFIIAVVQLARYALAYLDYQTKSLQKKNTMVRIMMKVVQCLLWCFEKVLKYITKNAYVMIAITGDNFCSATKSAFMLILNNFARMGVATVISNMIILLGRLVIVAAAALGCGAWVTLGSKNPSTIVVPVLVTSLVAWFVSGCFMGVYGLAIDTIMVSFCLDEKRNDGSAAKPYYMSSTLRRIINKSNKLAVAQRAAAMKDGDDDSDDEEPAKKGGKPATDNGQPEVSHTQTQLL